MAHALSPCPTSATPSASAVGERARDRRRLPRFPFRTPCKVLDLQRGKYHGAVGVDRSADGILIELMIPLRFVAGDRLLIGLSEGGPVLARDAMRSSTVVRVSCDHGRTRLAVRLDAERTPAEVEVKPLPLDRAA